MVNFNRTELRDKIYACWLGKNIGGTLGTPFEGKREVLNVTGFNSKPGNPLPNDDLDLQLIWLLAIMDRGKDIDERVLAQYWLEYISPHWNEYGIGKSNLVRGLVPPFSGEYKNNWKHSNGAWIRTEVWACLNPGLVEETIRYGYMDACVDHGRGDGTYATIFVAAMESAAFVVSDIRELIAIGLSKIPADCRFATFINTVLDAYDSGKTWLEARNAVTDMALNAPDLGWFQAPTNVAYAVIGLLYGGGDFKQSILTAVNCGDDTDCTGATVGALLGIIGGTKVIPDDWKEYIGDGIVTVAINRGAAYGIPLSCTALTDKIMELHPIMFTDTQVAHRGAADIASAMHPSMLHGKNVKISDEPTSADAADIAAYKGSAFADLLATRSPYSFNVRSVIADVWVELDGAPELLPGESLGVKLDIHNLFISQKHFEVRFILPEGWRVEGHMNLWAARRNERGNAIGEYRLIAGDKPAAKNRIIIEISCEGYADVILIPLVILG